jgi:hypothetical protein
VIKENKRKLNVNNENHLIHHLMHEVVLWKVHKVEDHHRAIWEDLVIILHVAADDQRDHSVRIWLVLISEVAIFSFLDTNNFGAFGGDNSMGGGPPSRGGPSQRGNNRGGGGGGGGVSNEKIVN